MYTDCI